jgi:hypothetical protein
VSEDVNACVSEYEGVCMYVRKGEEELAEAVLMISNCSCARTHV